MKTTTVARGFIGAVASLLGVVAVGCSAGGADEASAGNGEIGSVEQPLNVSATLDNMNTPGAPDVDAPRDFSAACKIYDTTQSPAKEYMLVMGGTTGAGVAVSNDMFLFDPAGVSPSQWVLKSTFNTARSHAQAIEVPGAADKCLLTGGQDILGAAVAAPRLITLTNSGGLALTDAAAGTGFVARSKFKLEKCGSGSVIAVGGYNGATQKAEIQRWANGANWTTTANSLPLGRGDLSLAPTSESNSVKFLVAGGNEATVGESADVTTLVFSTNSVECDTVDVDSVGSLSVQRDKPEAFEASFRVSGAAHPQSRFFVAGGYNALGGATLADADEVEIDWTSNPPGFTLNPSNSGSPIALANAAIQRPTLVRIPVTTANPQYTAQADVNGNWITHGLNVLIGGETVQAGTTTTNDVQKLVYVSNVPSFVIANPNNLSSNRAGLVAEFLPSLSTSTVDSIVETGGHTTNTALATTQKIATP